MKKIMVFAAFALLVVLFSAFTLTKKPGTIENIDPISKDLERISERKMLETIEYIEEEEEIDLGFDPYFNLPFGFNPYEGMTFDLDEIEYIEFEE